MAQEFDTKTLDRLRRTQELRILTGENLDKTATIWIVVADSDVFIRSFLGPKSRWYKTAIADGRATLDVDGTNIAVRVIPANDAASVERASREFLGKYSPSPYAQQMVRPEVLMTTLRLEPL